MRIVPANRPTTAAYTRPLFCSVRVQANVRTEISVCFDRTFLTSRVSSVDRMVGLSCTCISYVTHWEHMSCQKRRRSVECGSIKTHPTSVARKWAEKHPSVQAVFKVDSRLCSQLIFGSLRFESGSTFTNVLLHSCPCTSHGGMY